MPKSTLLHTPDLLILNVRGHRVILDSDLAALYGVTTKALNQAVKRNQERFPESFLFPLTMEEAQNVLLSRSQNVTLKRGQNIKYLPNAFTEHGALMAANVLQSKQAIAMSIELINTFIRLRQMALSVEELARKVEALERGFNKHGDDFKLVFDALRQLLTPPVKPRREIGFHSKA